MRYILSYCGKIGPFALLRSYVYGDGTRIKFICTSSTQRRLVPIAFRVSYLRHWGLHLVLLLIIQCRELYQCVKNAMERAAARGRVSVEGRALGGEFPVHDTETNQGGLLQVRCDGVAIIFANSQVWVI